MCIMDENDVALRERVTRVEADLKNEIHEREKLSDVIDEIRNIVLELRYMRTDMKKIDDKVNALEEKPAKRWESAIAAIIGAVAGGLGGALISKLIGG